MPHSLLPPQPALPPEEELSSETSAEDVAAPHLAAGAESGGSSQGGQEEWVPYDYDAPEVREKARALTRQEKWPSEWHSICWMAAHGASQNTICRELDYSVSRVSVILNKPEVQQKIEQIRREFLGTESLNKKYAAIAPKAADFFSRVVEGKEAAKVSERLQASQWILEKVSGKPKQEIELDGGTTILQLLQALEAKKAEAASAGEREARALLDATTMDVTPAVRDPLADWVSQNVPDLKSEKG